MSEQTKSNNDNKCHEDCKTIFKCGGSYYCMTHMDKFDSINGILCCKYIPDKVKIVTEKTTAMQQIDINTDEDKKRLKKNKETNNKIEVILKNHTKECLEFKIIMDLLYCTITYKNGGILVGSQLIRSHFHSCPCCGIEFEISD